MKSTLVGLSVLGFKCDLSYDTGSRSREHGMSVQLLEKLKHVLCTACICVE